MVRPLALPLPALALLLLAGPDASASPRQAANELLLGKKDVAAAVEAWGAGGHAPDAVLAALRSAPRGARRSAAPAPVRELRVEDRHGRATDVQVRFPARPGRDGRYGVLLILHGLGGDESQLLDFAAKIAPPGTIVVAPGAKALPEALENEDALLPALAARALPHWWSYRPDAFPLLALDELVARYPIDTDRVTLCGYSMGGYGTWNLGLRYPSRFAAIAPLAGGISRAESVLPRDERTRALLENARMVPSFFVHGDEDRTVPARFSRTIAGDLEPLGARFVYEEVAGGKHILSSFLRGDAVTRQLAGWLSEQTRDPHPRRVVHTVLGEYHGASYWLRIDALTERPGRATAEVTARDRIEVETRGVGALTLFLDPELLDVAGSITVTVNGDVLHEGPVAPSLEAVAESLAAHRDPALTYSRALRLELHPAGKAWH